MISAIYMRPSHTCTPVPPRPTPHTSNTQPVSGVWLGQCPGSGVVSELRVLERDPSTETMSLWNQQPNPGSAFPYLAFLICKTELIMPTELLQEFRKSHDIIGIVLQFASSPFLLHLRVLWAYPGMQEPQSGRGQRLGAHQSPSAGAPEPSSGGALLSVRAAPASSSLAFQALCTHPSPQLHPTLGVSWMESPGQTSSR